VTPEERTLAMIHKLVNRKQPILLTEKLLVAAISQTIREAEQATRGTDERN
jgi:hypothetical protein